MSHRPCSLSSTLIFGKFTTCVSQDGRIQDIHDNAEDSGEVKGFYTWTTVLEVIVPLCILLLFTLSSNLVSKACPISLRLLQSFTLCRWVVSR